MTLQELRVFLQGWQCGCGNPEDAVAALKKLLEMHEERPHAWLEQFKAWVPDDGVQMILLYLLDHWELTEHGGSVWGAWLSPKGHEVLDALRRAPADFMDGTICIHGFDIDKEEHQCLPK